MREESVNPLSVDKLLSDIQFGFRKTRSTILQLLTVMNEWKEALDDGIQIDTVFLDFRKNSTVCHIKDSLKSWKVMVSKEFCLNGLKTFKMEDSKEW